MKVKETRDEKRIRTYRGFSEDLASRSFSEEPETSRYRGDSKILRRHRDIAETSRYRGDIAETSRYRGDIAETSRYCGDIKISAKTSPICERHRVSRLQRRAGDIATAATLRMRQRYRGDIATSVQISRLQRRDHLRRADQG